MSTLGMQGGGPLNMMGVSSPSGTSNLVRFPGTSMDPRASASLRPGLQGSASSLVPPRWEDQMNTSGSGTPSSRSLLSLWLGTGPGPGNESLLGTSTQQLASGGTINLSPMDSYTDGGGTTMAGMLNTLEFDGQKPLAGMSSGSHNSNFFLQGIPGAGLLSQPGSGADMGAMSAFSDFGALSNWAERGSGERLPHATSAARSGGSNGPATLPSISSLYNQAHSSSAQMSATALLQKAAQMGATASNTSLLKGFGMAGSDTSSGALRTAWPSSSQDSGRAATPGMISSLVQNHSLMRESSLPFPNMGTSNGVGGDTRSMENTGLHELLNSLPGGSGLLDGLSNNTPLGRAYCDPRSMGGVVLQGNGSQCTSARDTVGHAIQQTSHGVSKPPLMNGPVGNFGSLVKAEDRAADRFTRDFLGVAGVNSIVGTAGGPRRSLSHRDFASIV